MLRHGFILNHARHCVTWDGLSIPMSNNAHTNNNRTPTVTHFTCTHRSAKIYAAGTLKIKMAKYDKVDSQMVASQCNHLSSSQQTQLGQLLSLFPDLFSGKLGRYNKSKFTLQLQDPTTPPIFCKPYPVPQDHMAVFKQELDHLLDKGILTPISCSVGEASITSPKFILVWGSIHSRLSNSPKDSVSSALPLPFLNTKDCPWESPTVQISFNL